MSEYVMTEQQKADLEVYRAKFVAILKDTTPTNRKVAEEAFTKLFKIHNFPVPTFKWFDNIMEAAKFSYICSNKVKSPEDALAYNHKGKPISRDEAMQQVDNMAYGTLEAYWITYYKFLADKIHCKEDPALDQIYIITQQCGPYWIFTEGMVVVVDKPIEVHLNDKLQPHNPDGPAFAWTGGSKSYAINGTIYSSLAEMKMAQALDETDKS